MNKRSDYKSKTSRRIIALSCERRWYCYMFSEELIKIIEKYFDKNSQQVNHINSDIQDIIKQLSDFRDILGDCLKELLCNNENTDELYNDIKLLNTEISMVKPLPVTILNLTEQEIAEELDPISPIILKPVKLYLCEDNICPVCGCSMDETHTVYSENNYDRKLISSYRCNCCNRFFVCDYVIDEIDISKTNLQIIKDYYFKIPEIDIEQVIVLKNSLPCSSQHHTRDLTAKIPILDENCESQYVEVRASYCFDCKRFTILKDDFDKISDIVTCKVIDETSIYKNYPTEHTHEQENDVSILKLYGYNVQTKKNISDQQRHIILSSIIEAGIMTRRQVIDLIETNMKRKSTRPDCELAVQKWQDDINFVNTYKTEELPKVVLDKIVLKYKNQNQ